MGLKKRQWLVLCTCVKEGLLVERRDGRLQYQSEMLEVSSTCIAQGMATGGSGNNVKTNEN